jgi:hypothetical protein
VWQAARNPKNPSMSARQISERRTEADAAIDPKAGIFSAIAAKSQMLLGLGYFPRLQRSPRAQAAVDVADRICSLLRRNIVKAPIAERQVDLSTLLIFIRVIELR